VRRSRLAVLAALALAAGVLAIPGDALAGKDRAGTITAASAHSAALGEDIAYNVYLPYGYAKGSQRYPIPAGVDLKDYASVIIWCEQFGVLISPADLTVATASR